MHKMVLKKESDYSGLQGFQWVNKAVVNGVNLAEAVCEVDNGDQQWVLFINDDAIMESDFKGISFESLLKLTRHLEEAKRNKYEVLTKGLNLLLEKDFLVSYWNEDDYLIIKTIGGCSVYDLYPPSEKGESWEIEFHSKNLESMNLLTKIHNYLLLHYEGEE